MNDSAECRKWIAARRLGEKYDRIRNSFARVAGGFKAAPTRAGAVVLGFFPPKDVCEALDYESYVLFLRFIDKKTHNLPSSHLRHGAAQQDDPWTDILDGYRAPQRYIACAELHGRSDWIDGWIAAHPSPLWLGLLVKTPFIDSRIERLLENAPEEYSLRDSLRYVMRCKRHLARHFRRSIDEGSSGLRCFAYRLDFHVYERRQWA